MRILVSTTMRMPSGTSSGGLLAICGLLDDLLYQRVLSHGESGKGAVDNVSAVKIGVRPYGVRPYGLSMGWAKELVYAVKTPERAIALGVASMERARLAL